MEGKREQKKMDIVRFKGGIGNQMFQYAFAEALRSRGREVTCNLGFYRKNTNAMPFVLNEVFPNVVLNEVDDLVFQEIDKKWQAIKSDPLQRAEFEKKLKERFFWVEDGHCCYNPDVFETQNCVFVGYWQTEKYFCALREKLLQCFSFQDQESKLLQLGNIIYSNNYVSVHVRRGDFERLESHRVCTLSYYRKAIEYVKRFFGDMQFIFFSDDIEWVKANLKEDGIICESGMFDDYRDWYDMYLMTRCRGNIISNSSFSWWGAWLNNNNFVIAPKVWLNGIETPDIWRSDWIRL